MMRALYSSVSGLRTHQTKMDVIGNNIANVNTVGFKSSRTTFSTMMYQTTAYASGANAATGKGGVNAMQIGLGTTFASTAVDIDTGGASESTGKAFDLKLSDTNSTSFYIVNNGSENVFTRAGAFYVDGAGNLCMESTGYTVMGWQVDANGNIVKDTVTPLRIMSPQNQTSQPEYTTDAKCTGILDDNNANVNSDKGYMMSLNFFDNLGYSYNAKFSVQKTGAKDDGEYTVNLTDIIDSNGKSIMAGASIGLSDLFGSGSQGSKVDVTDSYTLASGMANALKKLATDPDTTVNGTTTSSTRTYKFPSELINEKLGTTLDFLPEGLTVEYTVTVNDQTGENDLTGATSFRIVDGAGVDVTQTYIAQFDPTTNGSGWVTADGITHTITATDMIEQWNNRNLLDKKTIPNNTTTPPSSEQAYFLKPDQLQQLKDKFKGLNADGTPATGGNVLDQNSLDNMQIRVKFKPDGTVDTIEAYNPPAGDTTWGDVATFLTGATKNETIVDYLNQGYLSVTAEEANTMGIFTTELPRDLEIQYKEADGSFKIVTPATDGFKMQFSTADGSLMYIGQEGSTSQTLKLSMYQTEENPFSDIQIDFSTLQNLANGATNTAAVSPGGADSEGKGKRVGVMTGLQVDNSGKIYGSYSNGNTVLLGQIAVARFANASGLESIGDNCYRTTMNSGEFDGIGVEMDSDGSSIDSGTLEMSNVDLATEFTQMITTQRGYQANSRVISTSDSILEELVNLKR